MIGHVYKLHAGTFWTMKVIYVWNFSNNEELKIICKWKKENNHKCVTTTYQNI
jgi:hypothetical protein